MTNLVHNGPRQSPSVRDIIVNHGGFPLSRASAQSVLGLFNNFHALMSFAEQLEASGVYEDLLGCYPDMRPDRAVGRPV